MGDIVTYVTETFGGTQLSTTQDFWTLFNKVIKLTTKLGQ